jgi:ribonuclease-3
LGYTFQHSHLLKQALTHKSAAPSTQVSAFERLEFLGDRVLGLVISHWLYEHYPDENERDMALRLSQMTDRQALSRVASQIALHNHLTRAGGGKKDITAEKKILSDGVEALLGAIFLDHGLRSARSVIKRLWKPLWTDHQPRQDAKSRLQEWSQATYGVLPTYRVLKQSGPDHAPCLHIEVALISPQAKKAGLGPVSATGPSRKEAEQKAASAFLKQRTNAN